MATKTIEERPPCDHCGRHPKDGLCNVLGELSNDDKADVGFMVQHKVRLCRPCTNRVQRFMERWFTAKVTA